MAVLDKHKVSLTTKWLSRVVSLHLIAPGRPVMLPEVACFGPCVSEPSSGEVTWEKNTIKRVLLYVRWLKTLTQVDSIITHAHIPSPHCNQRGKSHSDAVEITLKKLASFSSVRLRGVVMARNRKGHPYSDVTTIRQTRYFRSDNVRFKDGGAVDIGKLGRGRALSSDYSIFLSMSALAQVHIVIMYRHKTTVLLWPSGLVNIRVLFMYDVCQYAWRIASIRFNNVSLCPLILIPNMSGLLCPLLLNPGSRFASRMRANH